MYGWIDATQYSFNALLLMDSWILSAIASIDAPCASFEDSSQLCAVSDFTASPPTFALSKGKIEKGFSPRLLQRNQDQEFGRKLGLALAANPAVLWYIVNRCPQQADYYRKLVEAAPLNCSPQDVRDCEVHVLDALDSFVVYVYPEVMEDLPYIRDWDPERLLTITDFKGKTVLDIGAGTGRLAFAAVSVARVVYASEPVDRLRQHMKEKAKRLGITNLRVLDGTIESLPFEDESFDIVMSGHVLDDDLEAEYREMSRVLRPGGWIIDCPGEEHRKKPLNPDLVKLGFKHSHYVSKTGGDVYRYWRQKETGC